MKKHSKRFVKAKETFDSAKQYSLIEAVGILKKFPGASFNETVELAVRLGVDPKQSDQQVRGTVALPHGSGKKVKVLVFAKGEAAKQAKDAGADYVGLDDLVQKITGGWFDFDVVIAAPDTMKEVGKLGKVLGPKGLMPSPKSGTVTPNVNQAVKEVKAGRVEFKVDKGANVHLPVGKINFEEQALTENAGRVIEAILRAKPSSSKGHYLRGCALSTTMGPGVRIDLREFL
ncbi:MAG: 50S ribosomal protein L1 [Chlamydiota bacterium]|nr:50S ribosomal protein L1 [Chlamydiota bacterium]